MTKINYKTFCREGAFPTILINNQRMLTPEQYANVLQNIRKSVETVPLVQDDDTTPGAKSTTVTWGLCSGNPDHYPDMKMHTFPKDFVESKRVSELSPPEGFECPLRKDTPQNGSGCFYHCKVFQNPKHKHPTQVQALRLIDAQLERLKNKK